MAAEDLKFLRDWIGREETRDTLLAPAPAAALAATLDHASAPGLGEPLPPLWAWLYGPATARSSELGEDGHPKRGGFLPPVPLPRRMWAGSSLTFHRPLVLGDTLTRRSVIADVSVKAGRSGTLVFVTVEHTLSDRHGPAVAETRDIVYRAPALPGEPAPAAQAAPSGSVHVRTVLPDSVLLFRYSALTFNGHRIHYDRDYATQVEGYPALVVHGPLIATLLIDHLQRSLPGAVVRSFSFRALRPAFDGRQLKLCAAAPVDGTVALWAQDDAGWLCMSAQARLSFPSL